MVKIPKNKKLYSDDGDFDYIESDPEYDPSGGDPLRKQKKMDYIGGEMDELASTGYRGGSTAGGPLSNPTQYGDVGGKFDVPFAGQQSQQLSPQRALEGAIEDAIDAEISNYERAIKSGDVIGEMTAGSNINKLQDELSRELQVSQKAQETMGETYEDRGMRKRVTQAYGGRVDPTNVDLAIEDARPLPTTKKGKGKGIKSAEAIIKTGLESKQIPYDTLKSGEYSFSKSSLGQASVEKALREGAQPGSTKPTPYTGNVEKRKLPYDFRESMFGNTKGILGETTADAGKTYGRGPTFTGVDKQGNIQQPRQAVDFGDTSHLDVGKGDTYFRETGPKQSPGGREIKNFSAGGKVSGNKVGSVTPDAPKAVVSNEPFDMKKAYSDAISKGMTPRQAQKDAERRLRISKIKGKGKGKGKLFTTLGAVGIGAILNKDR